MKFSKLSKQIWSLSIASLMFSLGYANSSRATDELVFSTPPTQSEEETLTNFQPLVDYLSRASGKKIVIKPARTFYQYAEEMRAGKYDLIFDGPHFIKYRLDKMQHVVLAKQPGDLHFVVVVRKDSAIEKLSDLTTKRVCSPKVPHLGTLSFLELFPNPTRQPELKPVQGFAPAIKCLDDNKAQAAVVRDKYWEKRVQNKDNYRVIHTTQRKMPARGMTISSRVDEVTRARISQALVDAQGNKYLEKAFSTFGGSRFVIAQKHDFDGLEELLQVVWGFHI